MSKIDEYRSTLRELPAEEWDRYLLANSGLPGPRGNIELAQAVADEGDAALFERYLALTPDVAPVNSPEEFLAFTGVVGLGRLLAGGDDGRLPALRAAANDPRWRTREAVAMALQRLGEADMDRLCEEMRAWAAGSPLEQRAAIAGLCEPRLLRHAEHAVAALDVLDAVTCSLKASAARKSDEFVALRKGLAYCWSVAVAALPDEGKARMEHWFAEGDQDVRWVMRENLKKNRLVRIDPAWAEMWTQRLASGA